MKVDKVQQKNVLKFCLKYDFFYCCHFYLFIFPLDKKNLFSPGSVSVRLGNISINVGVHLCSYAYFCAWKENLNFRRMAL